MVAITKETRLKDLFSEYPWLKTEITKINKKFRLVHSPLGKIMANKADISEMSNKSGMDADDIIAGITKLIESHK